MGPTSAPPAGREGPLATPAGAAPGEPILRWRSRARTIEEIERELARIWSEPTLTTVVSGVEERFIAARTSVMNLVVIARSPEDAEHCAAIIQRLTGRHPSRTLIVSTADPDGPSWLDAQIQAHCILPREDAPETCAEMIYLTAGGEGGRHLEAIVAPLLIHDLPVVVWWPGEPPFGTEQAKDVFEMADRVVVDGSSWQGDGLNRLAKMARLLEHRGLAITDFALLRQSRWREAIASAFDDPELLPYVRSLRRIAVTYGTHDEEGAPGSTNIVKPVYHVAWLASRLGLSVETALHPVDGRPHAARRPSGRPTISHGLAATLRGGSRQVAVVIRPVVSETPSGRTLRVELLCERRGSELRIDVTAEAETVVIHAWQDGVAILERTFVAPRRTEADLLAEVIEAAGRDPVMTDVIAVACDLAGAVAAVPGRPPGAAPPTGPAASAADADEGRDPPSGGLA